MEMLFCGAVHASPTIDGLIEFLQKMKEQLPEQSGKAKVLLACRPEDLDPDLGVAACRYGEPFYFYEGEYLLLTSYSDPEAAVANGIEICPGAWDEWKAAVAAEEAAE